MVKEASCNVCHIYEACPLMTYWERERISIMLFSQGDSLIEILREIAKRCRLFDWRVGKYDAVIEEAKRIFTEAADDGDSAEHVGMQWGILTVLEQILDKEEYEEVAEWFKEHGWS